jgi:hypothetical protein
MYLLFCLIPLITYSYIKIYTKKNINDFTDLKNSIKSVHPEYNKIILYKETLKLIFYKYKEEFLQYKFGIVKNNNGNIHVNYYKNHTLYTIIVKKNIKRNMIVYDQNNEDVTLKIKRFLGFNNDFHGTLVTPIDIGYNKLTFYIGDNDKLEFENNEPIKL